MVFYSNPFNDAPITGKPAENEIQLELSCRVFQAYNSQLKKDQTVVHHYMPQNLNENIRSSKYGGDIQPDSFFINRTDLNEQFFRIKYTDSLSFLDVESSTLYLYKQDPQWTEVKVPEVLDTQGLADFKSMNNTFKLMESSKHTIGETYAQLTNLVTEPINYIHKGVANKTAWHMPGDIPFFYILELNDTSFEITPESDIREPQRLTLDELS